jgi:hypothetical protein
VPSGLYLPRYLVQGRKPTAIVFYYCSRTDRILVGAPEVFPVPKPLADEGYQKIVCRSAHDVEVWSKKLQKQEARDQEIEKTARHGIEGPMRDKLRSEVVYARDHASNAFNRDALQHYLEEIDRADSRREKETSISYMHCEAAEEGH